jgi:hypothetical protein
MSLLYNPAFMKATCLLLYNSVLLRTSSTTLLLLSKIGKTCFYAHHSDSRTAPQPCQIKEKKINFIWPGLSLPLLYPILQAEKEIPFLKRVVNDNNKIP